MPHRKLSLALVALLLLSGYLVNRSPSLGRTQTNSACCGVGGAVGLRELDFPYYSLREGFSSQLNLVSDSPHPMDLTIAIYSERGNNVITTMTIQPNGKLPIDLRALLTQLLADVNGEFGEGSIAVHFEGTIMPVVGQVTLTNPALRLVHESEMVENDPGRTDIPPILNGLWWNLAPGRDARIMVANMSVMAVTADVYLEYHGQRHPSVPLTFSPHELKVFSVIQLLEQDNVSPSEAPDGGITIMQRGGVPKLIAQGKILDSVTGFSTTLHFPSPDSQPSSTLHASGLPVGSPSKDSPFAGMGTFVPHLVARNLLPTPQTLTVTVEYPTKKGSGGDSDRKTASTPPSLRLTLPPARERWFFPRSRWGRTQRRTLRSTRQSASCPRRCRTPPCASNIVGRPRRWSLSWRASSRARTWSLTAKRRTKAGAGRVPGPVPGISTANRVLGVPDRYG